MKRVFDVLVTILALLVIWPVVLLIAFLVRVRLGSPVLFRQVRPGLGGRGFETIKFRTMTDARDADGVSLPDSARLTPFGMWLRSTSLDELPEFWNVLRGEMSLVGPRPLLMEYLPLYSADQARRHDVKPGLTGAAQVMGRNKLTWPDKLRIDTWYVENQSMLLDFKILWMTVGVVLMRRGIAGEGEATMAPFKGEV